MKAPRFDADGNVMPPNIYRDKSLRNRKAPYFGQFMRNGRQTRTGYHPTIASAEVELKALLAAHGLEKDAYGRIRNDPEVENRLRVLEVALTNALARIEAMERHPAGAPNTPAAAKSAYEATRDELADISPDWMK